MHKILIEVQTINEDLRCEKMPNLIMEVCFMKRENNRSFDDLNYMKKGSRTQHQFSKNQIVKTIEEPAKNESGIEAERKGYK